MSSLHAPYSSLSSSASSASAANALPNNKYSLSSHSKSIGSQQQQGNTIPRNSNTELGNLSSSSLSQHEGLLDSSGNNNKSSQNSDIQNWRRRKSSLGIIYRKEQEYYPQNQHPPYFDSMKNVLDEILKQGYTFDKNTQKHQGMMSGGGGGSSSLPEAQQGIGEAAGMEGTGAVASENASNALEGGVMSPESNQRRDRVSASSATPRNSLMQRVASIKSILSQSSFANLTAISDQQQQKHPSQFYSTLHEGLPSDGGGSSQSSLNASLRSTSQQSPLLYQSSPSSSLVPQHHQHQQQNPTTGHVTNGHQPLQQYQGPPAPPTSISGPVVSVPPLRYQTHPHLSPPSTLPTPLVPFQPQNRFPHQSNYRGATVVPAAQAWRYKISTKTTTAGLILALNIGTDPPSIEKPNPCAKLQSWFDPTSTSRSKARDIIADRLEESYSRWQFRGIKIKFNRIMDPTNDNVRAFCQRLRREARHDRVLLHYSGHGVPRATVQNGEIWVFDSRHTQYIPLSARDLRRWISKPSIVVLDCHGAGALIPFLTQDPSPHESNSMMGAGGGDIFSSVLEQNSRTGPGGRSNRGPGGGNMAYQGFHTTLNDGGGGGMIPTAQARQQPSNMRNNIINTNPNNRNEQHSHPLPGGVAGQSNLRNVGLDVGSGALREQDAEGGMGSNNSVQHINNRTETYPTRQQRARPNRSSSAQSSGTNVNISSPPPSVLLEGEDPDIAYHATNAIRNVIVLCPVSANEDLPLNPELPGKSDHV